MCPSRRVPTNMNPPNRTAPTMEKLVIALLRCIVTIFVPARWCEQLAETRGLRKVDRSGPPLSDNATLRPLVPFFIPYDQLHLTHVHKEHHQRRDAMRHPIGSLFMIKRSGNRRTMKVDPYCVPAASTSATSKVKTGESPPLSALHPTALH